jgi:hypothetical protein
MKRLGLEYSRTSYSKHIACTPASEAPGSERRTKNIDMSKFNLMMTHAR